MTWGDPDCGGDSAEVQEQLRHVQQVRATNLAFAAIYGYAYIQYCLEMGSDELRIELPKHMLV